MVSVGTFASLVRLGVDPPENLRHDVYMNNNDTNTNTAYPTTAEWLESNRFPLAGAKKPSTNWCPKTGYWRPAPQGEFSRPTRFLSTAEWLENMRGR